jgi:hypothetical protein
MTQVEGNDVGDMVLTEPPPDSRRVRILAYFLPGLTP